MAKVLVAVLVALVAGEVVVALLVAGALFWLAAPQTIALGVLLLCVSIAAPVVCLRAMRAAR